MERVCTGDVTLDAALAGGFTSGASLLVMGEEGAGATEFALGILRAAAEGTDGRRGRFASALRSPSRVRAEIATLFESGALPFQVVKLDPENIERDLSVALDGLHEGDVLVIESADTLFADGDGSRLLAVWHRVADAAAEAGVVVVLLHAPGTLPRGIEAALAEEADGVLRFTWHDGAQLRRRRLDITKLRGLAPCLDGDDVPVFRVALHRGQGISVFMDNNVL
jgi:KaiC/GvpD/RAD55 family RecA-like ATPase